MVYLYISLGVLAFLIAAVLLISYYCYRRAFLMPKNLSNDPNDLPFLVGEIYEEFKESIGRWARQTRALPCEQVQIQSFDGLTLRGKYYEHSPDSTIEIMFHGYQGSGERDLAGGVQRCGVQGRSALVVDHRACGQSEGKVITFGINERRDCLAWVDFVNAHYGSHRKIILTGISMGAATVLMAAGEKLPDNVIGVIADCGYSSAKEIIKIVIKQMGLPADLAYPFVKLGARIYGHFDLEETSPIEAMANCTVPVIFFHGEQDDFVPCHMSRANFDACVAPKRLVTVPNAGHGLCFPKAPEAYLQALHEFFPPEN